VAGKRPRRPRLRWTQLAASDLEVGWTWLARRDPEAARRWAGDILRALERIEKHPRMGPLANDLTPPDRYRHVVVGRHRIIYRIDKDTLWILRVWDTRRDPAALDPE
jgi:plasmid stabilization system protein ParE